MKQLIDQALGGDSKSIDLLIRITGEAAPVSFEISDVRLKKLTDDQLLKLRADVRNEIKQRGIKETDPFDGLTTDELRAILGQLPLSEMTDAEFIEYGQIMRFDNT